MQAEEVENAEAMAADGLTSAEKVPKSLPPAIEAQAGRLPVILSTSCVLAMTSHRYEQKAHACNILTHSWYPPAVDPERCIR